MSKIRKLLIVFLVFQIVFLCACYNKNPFSEDTTAIAIAEESVVQVICYDHYGNEIATGSGFVMFEDDMIVTNHHVVKDAYSIKISTNQDITYKVDNCVACDESDDVAILKTEKATELAPLKEGNSQKIKKGETVTAIGSPLGIKNTVSKGNLSGRIENGDYDILQFTAPISHGSSGGALFGEKGEVIGVTYASIIDGQNLNLAIPIEVVCNLYNTKHESISISEQYWLDHPNEYFEFTYGAPITISFSQLVSNAEAYENTMIRVLGYVSSIDAVREFGTYHQRRIGVYLCSKQSYITNDTSVDSLSNDYIYVDTSLDLGDNFSVCIPSYITISPGDHVWITGILKKHETKNYYYIDGKDIDTAT